MNGKPLTPDKMEAYMPYVVGGGVVATSVIIAFVMKKYVDKWQKEKKRRTYPADTVILHQVARGPYAPNMSPFPVKLETYLRMAKIPYQNEWSQELSSKGKTPWMTYNGEDVDDSQICINYLNKKLEIDLNKNLNPEEKASGWAFQVMLEDHLYWSVAAFRFCYDSLEFVRLGFPQFPYVFIKYLQRQMKKSLYGQGFGRHSQEYVLQLAKDDILALSAFLGKKRYLMGDEPCEFDCSIFGFLSQIRWQSPRSVFEKTLLEDCKNLVAYCERMKERFWPDWDKCNTAGGTKEATA